MQRLFSLLCLTICLSALSTASIADVRPLSREQVPEPLKPWINWVMDERPDRLCPFLFDSYSRKRCSWPAEIRLDLTPNKGVFTLRQQIYAESWIALPGNGNYWPMNVTVNGKPALVMQRNDLPVIKLSPASGSAEPVDYRIDGEFLWDNIPDNLPLPSDAGLVNLTLNGVAIAMPALRHGQLWLKESETGQKKPDTVQNSVDVKVYRKIIDDVPMRVETRLALDVSGEQREIKLTQPLLDGFAPLHLHSPLPARLEADGRLLLQARPGHWEITVVGRSLRETGTLSLPRLAAPWPAQEIWAFESRPDLRVVEIEELAALDARLTTLPDAWQHLPAYAIPQGGMMAFKVLRRGDPQPEPNRLELARKLWLDFDGGGYTVNDTITGRMSSGWRLDALPQTLPGKVTLNGDHQLITRQAGSDRQGVEVRKGQITLDADSRIVGSVNDTAAVGWQQRFHQVGAELHLPPGWRLLAASGVDNVPESWVSRWTLLDLFLVLIVALATGRIWNAAWGGLVLLTLTLIWHEPDAPQFVWLHILAATALIKVLPAGRLLNVVRVYRAIAWLSLALIAVPFIVEQVRTGLYPQLEQTAAALPYAADALSVEEPMPAMEQRDKDEKAKSEPMFKRSYRYDLPASGVAESSADLERIDPHARIQTGPGLPQWQWHTVWLSWNGPVDAEQRLHLWYQPPPLTLALNFARAILLTALSLLMLGVAEKLRATPLHWRAMTPVWLALLVLPLYSWPSAQAWADYPDEKWLTELKTRLQAPPPDCLPACVAIQQMAVKLTEKDLIVDLTIHAQQAVALPLPSEYGQWFPNHVLDNGAPATAMYRHEQTLWIKLEAGAHHVALLGLAPALSKFTLPLPLKPKRVNVDKTGWEVVGLHENGWADPQLQFTRSQQALAGKPILEPGAMPSFVRIERRLQLGLDWRVNTRVVRESPADAAIVLNVPLLPGEAVVTPGIRAKDGWVDVNLPAQQPVLEWQSLLAKSETLTLKAEPTEQWVEIWSADISPIWHLDSSGIAMIRLQNTEQWLPEWHPWPGETVTLHITRPEAVAGQTLTIDDSQLSIRPGQRNRDVDLRFNVRSSQGMQHTLSLPDRAVLQSVSIDGQSQPIRQQGNKLSLPIHPGTQAIAVNWQESATMTTLMTTPVVDLALSSVNHRVNVVLGEDRWVLFAWGPRLGPAVLFWGVLIVILMLSPVLGRIPLTPLTTPQWFLLLVGLSQVPLTLSGIVIAWLVLLGWRAQRSAEARGFNALQVLLAALTLAALAVLLYAIGQGLLDSPDMRITGNASSAFNLNWYQDRSGPTLPVATLISVPLFVYRLLMLAWSLWLAVSLLDWLKWGWNCYAQHGLWKKQVALQSE